MATQSQTPKLQKELSNGPIVPKAALVPVVILKSEAGLGLRKGEVRGVSPEAAKRMFANEWAAPYSPNAEAAAKAGAAKDAAESDKDLDSI